jgi:hypothetical protein
MAESLGEGDDSFVHRHHVHVGRRSTAPGTARDEVDALARCFPHGTY